jgi:molybdate transport system regulatory protein
MNRLAGTLVERESNGAVTRVTVNLGSAIITAVLVEAGEPTPEIDSRVTVVFKESETALASGSLQHKLSIRNRLSCTITAIEDDGILFRVGLDFCGQSLGALITSESGRDLGLAIGSAVDALIKSTEVMVEAEKA